jgi:hypothetical protein
VGARACEGRGHNTYLSIKDLSKARPRDDDSGGVANWLSMCPEELHLGWTGIFEVPRDYACLP